MLQSWEAVLNAGIHTADGAALASSTSLTDISPTPNVVLGANSLVLGSKLKVTAAGRFSTTGTPTLLIGVYYGAVAGTALATTGALTTSSGATNLTWRFEAIIDVRSLGSSGTAMTTGQALGITAATAVAAVPASAPATATIDTTAAKALTLGAQWGTNSASNTITCHSFTVESLV